MEFSANQFLNRQDLEDAIKVQVGTEIEENRKAGHLILGTREELKKLHLSDTSLVFGIKVVATDITTTQILADKIAEEKKKK